MKHIKIIKIIIVALLSIYCLGCAKKHCPAYPVGLYYPYFEGKKLQFANSSGDIHTFDITKQWDAQEESFAWNCKCACSVITNFTAEALTDSLIMDGNIMLLQKNPEYNSRGTFFFKKTYKIPYGEENYGYEEDWFSFDVPEKYPYYETPEEHIIIAEGTNNKIVTKIIISSKRGLISYTTADGQEWNLFE